MSTKSPPDQPAGAVAREPDETRRSRLGGVQAAHWLFLVGVASAALILFWGVTRSPAAAFDDAYITYRYADNLRRGLGLLYNPGEWVLGTTTPLYTLLLGAVGLIIADLEWLGHWIGVLSWVGASWAALALFRQAGRFSAAIVAPLLIALQASLLSSVGMETPFLILLMLATAWAWFGQHKVTATLLAAALLLTRQDSAIWLLLLGLEIWRRERRLPWREGLGAILLALPWFMFAQWRYGSFLPNSAAAKFGQSVLMPVPGLAPFWQGLIGQGFTALVPLAAAALLVFILVALWAIIWGDGRAFWWLPAWLAGYTLFYTLSGVVTFPWYFTPALTGIALLAALGIGTLLGDEPRLASRPRKQRRLGQAAGIGLLAMLLWGQAGTAYDASQVRHGYQPAYRPAARWLAENSPKTSAVATIEIGVIGYDARRPIVDTMGLISRDMTDHQLGWQETLVYALNAYEPEYLVTLPNTAWDALLPEWWFQRDYTPAISFDNITLFKRVETGNWYVSELSAPLAQGITVTGISAATQQVQPGDELTANVNIQVDATPESSLLITTFLVDAQTFERFATTTTMPFSGKYDSKLWQPGDMLQVPISMVVPADLQPGTYRMGLVVFDAERSAGLPLRDDPGGEPPDLQTGWFRVGAPVSVLSDKLMESLPSTGWANGITLASLAVPAEEGHPGQPLTLQLGWRTTQSLSRNLTYFIHLTDHAGAIVSQLDSRPFAGRWPTPAWLPGEWYLEEVALPLPVDLTPGEYGLRLGWYDETGRLPLFAGSADNWYLPDVISISANGR